MKVALVNTEEHSRNYIETVLDTLIGMTVVVKGKTDSIEYVECFDNTPSPSVLVVFDNIIYLDGTLEPVDMFIKTFQTSTKPTVKGLKVCITGDFSNLRERMCEFLKSQGVVIQGHVSKDLDFLLVGEGAGKNAKVSKANEYGTVRGSIDKFLDTYDLHKEWVDFKLNDPVEELAKKIRDIYINAHVITRVIKDWSDLSETTKTRFRAIAKHFATPSSTLQTALDESLKSERELMCYLREIGKIFGKKVGVDIGVQDVVGLVRERYEYRGKLLQAHGVCEDCGGMYSHEITAPFANCGCGTSEWYEFTPFMKLQKEIHELESKSVDKLTVQEVAELTDEQRENLRKIMVEHSQNTFTTSVVFEQYNRYMIPGKDDVSLEYTPVAPASHVVQTIRDTVNTDDVKSSFVLEKWSNGEITVNNQNIGEWLVDCYEPTAANKVIEAVRNLK